MNTATSKLRVLSIDLFCVICVFYNLLSKKSILISLSKKTPNVKAVVIGLKLELVVQLLEASSNANSRSTAPITFVLVICTQTARNLGIKFKKFFKKQRQKLSRKLVMMKLTK